MRPIFDPTYFAPEVISPEEIAGEQAWRKDMDEQLAKSQFA